MKYYSEKLKSPLFWMGGKYHIANWIISYFDYSVKTYLELFGGAGHILFKKKPHKIEIFNDIDGEIINFFLILKEKKDELKQELEKIPYSREIFNLFSKQNPEESSNLERAVRWFYIIRNSFSGIPNTGWSYGFASNHAKHYFNSLNLFDLVQKRIKNVQFENRDYRKILSAITKEKQKDILIYVDPPYFDVNYYTTIWKKEDHEELAEWLNKLNCKIVISYYYFKYIEDWYPKDKWRYYTKEAIKYSVGLTINNPKTKRIKSKEVILLNYNNKNSLF